MNQNSNPFIHRGHKLDMLRSIKRVHLVFVRHKPNADGVLYIYILVVDQELYPKKVVL